MSKKKTTERDDSRRFAVVKSSEVPEGCVHLVEYKDRPHVNNRCPYKYLYSLAYRGKLDSWILYLNGRVTSRAPLFVRKSEAEEALREYANEKPAAPARKQVAPPVVNNRLVLALESIAGSLEMIAEVAVDHAPPAPPVIRQPSMNGHADKIPPY